MSALARARSARAFSRTARDFFCCSRACAAAVRAWSTPMPRALRGAGGLLEGERRLTLREGQPLAVHEREALALPHAVALLRTAPLETPADLGADRHHLLGLDDAREIQPVLDARRFELHDLDPGHPLGRGRGRCGLAAATGQDGQRDQQGADAPGVALGDVHVITTPFFPGRCSADARASRGGGPGQHFLCDEISPPCPCRPRMRPCNALTPPFAVRFNSASDGYVAVGV